MLAAMRDHHDVPSLRLGSDEGERDERRNRGTEAHVVLLPAADPYLRRPEGGPVVAHQAPDALGVVRNFTLRPKAPERTAN